MYVLGIFQLFRVACRYGAYPVELRNRRLPHLERTRVELRVCRRFPPLVINAMQCLAMHAVTVPGPSTSHAPPSPADC